MINRLARVRLPHLYQSVKLGLDGVEAKLTLRIEVSFGGGMMCIPASILHNARNALSGGRAVFALVAAESGR